MAAILILIGLGLAACSDPVQLPPLSADGVILAFGDSLTSGSGASRGEDYPALLAQLSDRRVINAGVPGEVSADGRQRLATLLDQHHPELLILIHGGNDILRKMDLARTRSNLEAMIHTARERSVAVVMMGVPKPGVFMRSADFYGELAAQTATPIDTHTLSSIYQNPSLKSDPIHPNAEGYRRIAEALYQLLDERGAL